jgi:hypothetical protein
MLAIATALGVDYEHYAARDTIKASITSQLRRLMPVTLYDNLPSRPLTSDRCEARDYASGLVVQ